MNVTLYELAQEHRALADKLADMELDAETIADTLEAEAGALEAKATATAMVVRNLESTVDAIAQAEEKQSKRKRAYMARAELLRQYLKQQMLHAGVKRIDHPLLTLAIKGKAAAVQILDEAQIPTEFMAPPPPAPPPKPSKTLIAAELKDGREVPGARMGDDVTRLEIG